MNIRFSSRYLSITEFEWEEIPEFAIITGPNGSGKTQLLDLIAKSINNPNFPNKVIIEGIDFIQDQVLHLTSEWALRDPNKVDIGDLQKSMERFYSEFRNFQNGNLNLDHSYYPKFNALVNKLGKPKELITQDEFYENAQIPIVIRNQNDFNAQIADVFFNYKYIWIESQLKKLSDEEFFANHGPPPWDILNEIFKEAGLPFEVNSPDQSLRKPFTLVLKNIETNNVLQFSKLSSGEQVIISMILWLYHARGDIVFPKLLLLDEPDAHLHPSMAKQFVETVYNVLVRNHGVRVIMTTHSPSTAALAPDDSLFVMNKTGVRIEPTNKDGALKILTTGVPTLSIDYENRRQVFVESKVDVLFYEKIYEKLRAKLIPEISISFIAAGVGGQGNDSQVKYIVNKLRANGNQSVFGIIDWDSNNEGNEYVKVPGKDRRYSLENYVFDPILLAGFLFRERYIEREVLGINQNENYTDFKNFDDIRLQEIVDYIIKKVGEEIGTIHEDYNLLVEYIGGKKVRIPSWYVFTQGHLLETKLKNVFNQLKRYQREEDLKKEIINKVVDDIPDFIPVELLKILREIQA
ncbi:MAG: AAA family ATPase [Anaerolineae bacterium]|nr:AAA family ATPase [Anaerolineae bacterium]